MISDVAVVVPAVTVTTDRFVTNGRRNWEQNPVASKVIDVGLFIIRYSSWNRGVRRLTDFSYYWQQQSTHKYCKLLWISFDQDSCVTKVAKSTNTPASVCQGPDPVHQEHPEPTTGDDLFAMSCLAYGIALIEFDRHKSAIRLRNDFIIERSNQLIREAIPKNLEPGLDRSETERSFSSARLGNHYLKCIKLDKRENSSFDPSPDLK
jgi:hypothetical protein